MDIQQLAILRTREIEQAFAACAMMYPLGTVTDCGWLSADDLLDAQVAAFWRSLISEVRQGMTDDEATSAAIRCSTSAGLPVQMAGWMRDAAYTTGARAMADEIARRQYITRMSAYPGKLAALIAASDDEGVARLVAEMQTARRPGTAELPDAFSTAEQFERIVNAGNRSLQVGIPNIDAAIGGLERQTEIVIAARPSMGKTALIWQIARNVATVGGRVAFFSLEMSKASLWARAACPIARVSWQQVRNGNLTPKQRETLLAESYTLGGQLVDNLLIYDESQTTETIWRTSAQVTPDLVIVDHLRLVKDKAENENKRQGAITERLKEIAKTLNCAVLVAAQLNRGVENRAEKKPQLSDLRDSGEIEENADVVLMMYRDSYYNPPEVQVRFDPVEVWVRKFRDGQAGVKCNLVFDAEREWFDPARGLSV